MKIPVMSTSNGDPPKRVLGTGYVTAPAECFAAEPTTGVYLDTPGPTSAYTVTKRGNKRLRISDEKTEVLGPFYADGYVPPSSAWLIPSGTEAAPGLAFVSPNSDTGIYLPRPETLSISCGGVDSLECTNNDIDIKSGACLMTQMYLKSDGDVFNPQITFQSQPGTGFYRDSGVPGVGVTNNSDPVIMFGSIIKPEVEIQSKVVLGPSQPAYGFDSQPGLGLSLSGTGGLAINHNGVEVLDVKQAVVTSIAPIDCGTNGMTCGSITSSSTISSTGQPTIEYKDNGGQSISTAVETIYLNWVVVSQQGSITPGASTTNITVTGCYLLTAIMGFAQNLTGSRAIFFRDNNGAYYGYTEVQACSSSVTRVSTSTLVNLTAGQYVYVGALQTSGGNLTVGTLAGGLNSEFRITKLW